VNTGYVTRRLRGRRTAVREPNTPDFKIHKKAGILNSGTWHPGVEVHGTFTASRHRPASVTAGTHRDVTGRLTSTARLA
jgi:hypothetical protein